jgi:hypothetical protein
MSKKTNQHGARKSGARTAIVIVIILAIVGVLGYVLWTNFIQKNINTSQAIVTKTKTFSYNKLSLGFNYPSNWVIADDAKSLSGTVTSPDGNVTVKYGAVAIDSTGGDCSLDSAGDSYTVTGLSSGSAPSTGGVIFRQLSTKYVSGASSTTYNYKFGLIDDTDNSFKNGKVGDYACNVDKIAASNIKTTANTDGSQYALSFDGSFKDLDAGGAGVTQAQIDKDFASSDAKTARDILESAIIK